MSCWLGFWREGRREYPWDESLSAVVVLSVTSWALGVPVEGHPVVIAVKADENSKRVSGQVWHSDVSCDAEPPMGAILHLFKVPENGAAVP